MKKSMNSCPKCGARLLVREYECERCGTRIIGNFQNTDKFAGLTVSQMKLLHTFVATFGNIGEVAKILGVSRPTAKARIKALGESMGIKMNYYDGEVASTVLTAIENGEISVDEAIERMKSK